MIYGSSALCTRKEENSVTHEGCIRDSGSCTCDGGRIERFIEPCLLLLLTRNAAHGYELMDGLTSLGFEAARDPGQVYRALRRLEQDNMVSSRWETGEGGPARRVYSISESGHELLAAWARVIQDTRDRLNNFLDQYEASKTHSNRS